MPAMVLTAKVLLEKNNTPSREEIREAIAGNICRCTGYVQIVDAVELAARRLRGDDAGEQTEPTEPAANVADLARTSPEHA